MQCYKPEKKKIQPSFHCLIPSVCLLSDVPKICWLTASLSLTVLMSAHRVIYTDASNNGIKEPTTCFHGQRLLDHSTSMQNAFSSMQSVHIALC